MRRIWPNPESFWGISVYVGAWAQSYETDVKYNTNKQFWYLKRIVPSSCSTHSGQILQQMIIDMRWIRGSNGDKSELGSGSFGNYCVELVSMNSTFQTSWIARDASGGVPHVWVGVWYMTHDDRRDRMNESRNGTGRSCVDWKSWNLGLG